ncbi:DUF2023 family protein [bacterium]|nr:DUF2023 family protein [bacterium]
MFSVLTTYIYEIKKGVKPCALITLDKNRLEFAIKKIEKSGLFYFVQHLKNNAQIQKINLFFGEREIVKVLEKIITCDLNKLCREHDFMLGILLGYDIKKQCERFLEITSKKPISA